MRFLVDRCAGVTLAKWLRDRGHDVEDASEWSEDPGDAAILERARHEDRILVTVRHLPRLLSQPLSGGKPPNGPRIASSSALVIRTRSKGSTAGITGAM
jgi:uncharacterized protein DUF5615